MHTVRVWDLPTRLFHWALVLCVAGLIITGNIGGNAMIWHGRLGYAVLTLLLFRLAWGLVGGHWSRFVSFVYAPSSVLAYLRGQGKPEHSVGHNPLGAFSVFAFLLVLLAQVGSGLFADDEIAFTGPLAALVSGDWVSQATRYHKDVGKLLLIALVALHLGAMVFYKFIKKQSLVGPMIGGDKAVGFSVPASQDNARTRLLALVVLALCGAAVYGIVSLGNGMVAASY
ncbi:MAG: cytochrome b/b6 domain-containing protein [Hydrogenophaga sp.]|jgi:cytochrome b|nr:cytochrome b/b6 domain-containing protein [Hydrogenophaga sp.]